MRGNFQPALFIWNFDPLSICYKQNAPSPRLSCRVVGSQKYKKPSKTQAPSTLPETPHRWEWMLIYIVYIIYIYIIYIIYIYHIHYIYISRKNSFNGEGMTHHWIFVVPPCKKNKAIFSALWDGMRWLVKSPLVSWR